MSPFGLPAAVFLSTFDYVALRTACGRLPSQRPLACVQVSGFRSPLFLPTPENSAGSPSERLKTCEIPNIKKIFQIMKKSVLFQDGF
jgi:hypothetical protein